MAQASPSDESTSDRPAAKTGWQAAKGATSGPKVKPSYKHIPHSQKPPHLVAKRNARERRRVQAVNQAFYKLRKCVPIENRNKRVSKVKTLQRAIDYIRKLEQTLAEDDEALAQANAQTSAGPFGDSQYGIVASQVATGSNLQQPPPQSSANNGTLAQQGQRRASKRPTASICDQSAASQISTTTATTEVSLDNNHHQPQIIMRQRRGRKVAAPATNLNETKPQTVSTDHRQPAANSNVCPLTSTNGDQLPNNFQQMQIANLSYSGTIGSREHGQLPVRHESAAAQATLASQQPGALMESHKFNHEPYYCHQTAYQQPQPAAEVLRESSAYNNSLNSYYNHHENHHNHSNHHQHQQQQQQQYSAYVSPNSSSHESQHQYSDMYTTNYNSTPSFYGAPVVQLGNYTAAAAMAAYASSSPTTSSGSSAGLATSFATNYLPPANTPKLTTTAPATSSGWQRLSGSGDSGIGKSETFSLNDSSSLCSTTNNNPTALNSSTSSSSSSGGSTRATSLCLLQSPASSSPPSASSSSTSSSAFNSATAVAANIGGNANSSTVVCRSLRSLEKPADTTSQMQAQQVNNYLAYASNSGNNRPLDEARAGHLSCSNANSNIHNGYHQNHHHHLGHQQQQLDELKTSADSTVELGPLAVDGGSSDAQQHQVRHLLSGGFPSNGRPSAVSSGHSANNLHDQQQQYRQHHHHHNHQQSTFANDQHLNANCLSALHSMAAANRSNSDATSPSPSTTQSLLINQQATTIQKYTSLPL